MAFLQLFAIISVMVVQVPAAPPKWIDLTYQMVENETIYWPGQKPYEHDLVFKGEYGDKKVFVEYYKYAAGEHGGTHMDAPNHFIENGIAIEQIPIDNLFGEGIMVNISEKAEKNPNAELEVKDLEEWEKKNGRIPDKPVVFLYSGRGNAWPDKVKYFGTNTPDNSSTFNFPGLHVDAVKWLIDNRNIKLFGLDTPSFDIPKNQGYPTHKALLGAKVPGIENAANLHKLPARGFEVFAFPMKIKDGTGAPVRVFARLTPKKEVNAATHAHMSIYLVAMVMALVFMF